MKFLAPLLLVSLAIVSVSAGNNREKMMMEKWAYGSAFENCFGTENFKKYMMMKKKAKAECSGMEAPELELPMFKSPYRIVTGLMEGASGANNGWMEEVMKKYMFNQMMSRFSQQQGGESMPFMKQRYRRQASGGGAMELGDRLMTKLDNTKDHIDSAIGNCTCVCKKMGIVDENDEVSLKGLMKLMDKFKMDPWLDEKLRADKKKCYEFSQALPQSFLDACIMPAKIIKYKMFHKCMKFSKTWTCMNFDMKKKLEANFGSVDDMVKVSGMEEKTLLPIARSMMMGKM